MKSIRFMLALFAAIAAARADDITLTDGRTFHEASIVSVSPLRVTVRHEGGLAQIDKRDLPQTLLAKYPIDQAAHEKAEREIEARRAKASAERAVEAKRIEESRAADIASRESVEARAKKEEKMAQRKQRERAERGADQYFRTKWRPGNNEVHINDCRLRINSVEEKADFSGKWTIHGEAWIRYYVASGRGVIDSKHVPFEGEVNREGEITIAEKL